MFNEVGILHFLLGFVLGHVCGSVPSGLWLVQAFHGIDIRITASKNIGTTNVFRIVGPKTAVLVLIADASRYSCGWYYELFFPQSSAGCGYGFGRAFGT